jgi:superfamily II DNA or RNA helicase
MIQFRDYQEQIIDRGLHTLQSHGFLYLSMEVRTGKTLTALGICDRMPDVNRVLFLTKKKAISSITDDPIR